MYYPTSLRRTTPINPSTPVPIRSNEDGSGVGLAVPLISTSSPVGDWSWLVTMKSSVFIPGKNPLPQVCSGQEIMKGVSCSKPLPGMLSRSMVTMVVKMPFRKILASLSAANSPVNTAVNGLRPVKLKVVGSRTQAEFLGHPQSRLHTG